MIVRTYGNIFIIDKHFLVAIVIVQQLLLTTILYQHTFPYYGHFLKIFSKSNINKYLSFRNMLLYFFLCVWEIENSKHHGNVRNKNMLI